MGLVLVLLLVHKSGSALNALSIGRGLNLVAWHFHVELADAAACIESDAGSSTRIILGNHVTLNTCGAV